jgi:hypothetical protein
LLDPAEVIALLGFVPDEATTVGLALEDSSHRTGRPTVYGLDLSGVVRNRVSGLFFPASVYSWVFLVFFTSVKNRESFRYEVIGEWRGHVVDASLSKGTH